MEEILEEIATWLSEDIGGWIVELVSKAIEALFNFEGFHALGVMVWNMALEMIGAVASTQPDAFSTEAWTYLTNTVLDFTMGIGAALLNVFYLVGIIRQSTNLKENFTLEIFVDNVIKMLLANMLILNGLDMMMKLFDIASASSSAFISVDLSFDQLDKDVGLWFFNMVFGIFFFIVSLVCAGTVFLTLYNRYLYLYLLIAVYPLAFSTLPGGRGVNNSASAWTRTFISKTFEIVVIAIAVALASKMCNSINFGTMSGAGEAFNGVIQTIQAMATMMIMAGAVKGVDQFMKRSLGL